jgi:gas vesicle protein
MKNTDKLKKVKRSKGFSNIAVAMLAAAVTGAAIGILYAPVKGKKLRKKINRFTKIHQS